jgi:hypothetical protein
MGNHNTETVGAAARLLVLLAIIARPGGVQLQSFSMSAMIPCSS